MTKEESSFERKIRILEDPERSKNLPATELFKPLKIHAHTSILDIGAGTGYVTLAAAQLTEAPVYALDLDGEILDYLIDKAKKQDLHHIQALVGDFMDIPLADKVVDLAIASMSLHEVPSLPTALGEIYRTLKDQGQFLCVEFDVKEVTDRPRVPAAEMVAGLIGAGFTVKEQIFPDAQFLGQDLYILVAEKNASLLSHEA